MAVEQYRQYIRDLLSQRAERASRQRTEPEYAVQTVFDTEQDHYQILYVGWRGYKRDFGCILHVDIKEGEANSLSNLGIAYNGLGQYQQAIEYFQLDELSNTPPVTLV